MYYIGYDIGGTKCAVVLSDEIGVIIDKIRFETKVSRGYKAIISELCESCMMILRKNNISAKDIKSSGISCGGPLDSKKGIIMCPPNLPDWDEVHICEIIEKETGIKCFLQNDANACAVAEWKFGAGKGSRNMVFLTFGTGMGAGLILDGRLYTGRNDLAGEVGHMRLESSGPVGYGKAGSFEGFCSGGGIAHLGRMVMDDYVSHGRKTSLDSADLTAASIAKAAYSGDEAALEVYSICGRQLGKALAILIDILNPEKIVIGSIFERSGSLLVEEMNKTLHEEALPGSLDGVEIVPAELGDSIGDFASIGVAQMGDIS